jgi:4,5-dihydroxyphthalate decarboxylase
MPPLLRLFPEWRTVEQDYYRRTKLFPIMHIMGIRRDILAAHPTLARALVHAFDQAKKLAQTQLDVHHVLPVMLPWMTAELQATEALMGQDFGNTVWKQTGARLKSKLAGRSSRDSSPANLP